MLPVFRLPFLFNVVQDKEKIALKLGLDLNKHIILIMVAA